MSYKEFPKKFSKKLPQNYEETISSMDTEEIKKKILEAEGNIFEIDSSKEINEEILKAKEELKKLTEPLSEAKKMETAKIKYCIFCLEERGTELTKD